MTDVTAPERDDGYEVRLARVEDTRAIVHVLMVTRKSEYAGTVERRALEQMDLGQECIAWSVAIMRIAERPIWVMTDPDGRVVGFCRVKPVRADGVDSDIDAELTAIYLLPETCGRGLGSRFMGLALAWVVDQGFLNVCLWVLPTNVRAIALYRRYGFHFDGGTETRMMSGVVLDVVWYSRPLRASA